VVPVAAGVAFKPAFPNNEFPVVVLGPVPHPPDVLAVPAKEGTAAGFDVAAGLPAVFWKAPGVAENSGLAGGAIRLPAAGVAVFALC
jgi:hypothetical protein